LPEIVSSSETLPGAARGRAKCPISCDMWVSGIAGSIGLELRP
jgi:hypothetical protein